VRHSLPPRHSRKGQLDATIEQIKLDYADAHEIHVIYSESETNTALDHWPDVLAVFAVKTTLADEDAADVVALDADKQARLQSVFWGIQQNVSYSFGEWLDKWMEDYKKMSLKASTYYANERMIRTHIKPHMGDIGLKKVSPDDIQLLYQKMTLAGAKPATVHKVKNIINNAMEQAVKSRLIMYNPTRATVPPKMEQSDVRVFTPEEQTQFMTIIQGHRLEPLFCWP